MTPLRNLTELGQSVWYDYIRRDLYQGPELKRLIEEDDLRGITSNPTIFAKAMMEKDLYDEDIALRGWKFDTLEGGIRVPFAIRWTGHLPAQVVYGDPVSSLDIVATAAKAAGARLPADRPYDGLDLIPYLTGQQLIPQRTLFWRWFGLGASGPRGSVDTIYAARQGSLKLVRYQALGAGEPQLYDLAIDIGETQDLSPTRPRDVQSLKALYGQWASATNCSPLGAT